MSDCLIIGAGIIGMTTALALHERGLRITLLDKGNAGMESSWAGGGILSPLHPWRYPPAVSALVADSLQRYPAFVEKLEIATHIKIEYLTSGALFLDPSIIHEGQTWAASRSQPWQILDTEALTQYEPELYNPHHSTLRFPEIQQIRTPRLLNALKTQLQKLNIPLEEQQPAIRILHKNGRVTGIKTTRKTLTADHIIIAAGAWSSVLLKQCGLMHPAITPVKGQMILFKSKPGLLRHIILDTEGYLIPRTDGCILTGSTLEHTGFEKEITETARAKLISLAHARIPALKNAAVTHQWAGLRPGSTDGIPCISPHPQLENLFINAGHYRNGVAMAPGSATLLADLLTQQQPAINPAAYAMHTSVAIQIPQPGAI